jgi:type IV secretion system protein VirB10
MPKYVAVLAMIAGMATALVGQDSSPQAPMETRQEPQGPISDQSKEGLKQRQNPTPPPASGTYRVDPGTHILLNMINSVSTRQAAVGDRIYLETAFPILSGNRIVIPQGSWVTGTITEVKRPGRVKGRGELQVRFDSLTLPNGVTRDFRADLGALDGRADETLQHEQNKVKAPGDKGGDVGRVARTTETGTVIGSGVGGAAGNWGRGAGIGAGAGAAAGLMGVLLSRGPDATLSKGSVVEMVLDRPITFQEADLNFSNVPPRAPLAEGTDPSTRAKRSPGRVF